MKKKLIGLALSAAMLFSVLSVPAFAAAPEASADPALTTEQAAAEEENCFFTSSSTEEEKEPNSITYVALGDSICAGIGLTTVQYAHNLMGVDVSFNFKGYPETCYVGQVGKSLNLDRDHAINLGLPGVMSKDMLELVKLSREAHEELGRLAAESDLYCLVTYGENAKRTAVVAAAKGVKTLHANNYREAADALLNRIQPGDALLVKASRGMALEKALEIFYAEQKDARE